MLTQPKVKKKIPGPNAKAWDKYHMKHAAKSTYMHGIVRDRMAQANGPFFTDVDGNVILDFISHVAAAPLGYNHPKMVEFMMRLPIETVDAYAGTDFITGVGKRPGSTDIPTPSDLHHKLTKITKQFKFDTQFFSNSGTEAVENAMKICFHKNKAHKYFFCFEEAFHGRTMGSLALTRTKIPQRRGFPSIPYVNELPFCSCVKECRCGWKVMTKDGKMRSALEAKIAKDIGVMDPKEVAFIIVETIQGEGGYRIPNKSFIKDLVSTAKSAGIPVIMDEIQAGMGRTGKWWAAEHFGVKPDVMTSAKALQVGATMANKKMFPKEGSTLGGTWSEGHALASAMGYKHIELIEKEKLLVNAQQMGKRFLKGLQELTRNKKITDARGLGLMLAIDCDTKANRDKVLNKALQQGLLLAGAGYRTIRFIPPLNVTKHQIDTALEILHKAVK